MKLLAYFDTIFQRKLDAFAFEKLAALFPNLISGTFGKMIDIQVFTEDPRYELVHTILQGQGYRLINRPLQRDLDLSSEYQVHIHREYDVFDWENARLLELMPKDYAQDYGLKETQLELRSKTSNGKRAADIRSGPIGLYAKFLNPSVDFAQARERYGSGWIVVPDRVKRVVESASLIGPKFRETVLLDSSTRESELREISWDSYPGQRWWELISDITLPPMSPQMDLWDYRGNEFRPTTSFQGCICSEGNYAKPQFRYRQADLDKLPAWDLAFTFEALVAGRPIAGPYDRSLVASKRFYEFCRENDLKTEWVPVRIDPD